MRTTSITSDASFDSDRAEDKTCPAAAPECSAALVTPSMVVRPAGYRSPPAGHCGRFPRWRRPAPRPPRRWWSAIWWISAMRADDPLRSPRPPRRSPSARRRSAGAISSVAGRLVGQALHLVGHHGEALAGIAGPGRLDGGVQGQQIGLAGDVVDQFDHLADPLPRSRASPSTISLVPRRLPPSWHLVIRPGLLRPGG